MAVLEVCAHFCEGWSALLGVIITVVCSGGKVGKNQQFINPCNCHRFYRLLAATVRTIIPADRL